MRIIQVPDTEKVDYVWLKEHELEIYHTLYALKLHSANHFRATEIRKVVPGFQFIAVKR